MVNRLGCTIVGIVLVLANIGSAIAQSNTISGQGTANAVPLFTGTSTIGNSNITQSNGNVGIGTTSPGDMLDVVGNQNGFTSIRITNSLTTGASTQADLFLNNSSSYGQVFKTGTGYTGYKTVNANDFGFYTNGGNFSLLNDSGNINFAAGGASSVQMIIAASGHVGIGTTSPAYALDVTGQIHSSTGGFVFPDGSTQTTAYTPSAAALDSILTQSNGSVGIGSVNPSAIFGLSPTFTSGATQGINVAANANPSSTSSQLYYGGVFTVGPLSGNAQNFTQGFTGFSGQAYHKGTGTIAWEVGADGEIYNLSTGTISLGRGSQGYVVNTSSGNISTAQGFYAQIENTGGGTITNGYGLYVDAPLNTGGGAFTNFYGLYLAKPTAAANSYSLYSAGGPNYFGGNVGIGTPSPSSALEVNGNLTLTQGSGASIKFPDGTVQSTAYTGTCSTGGDYAESVEVTGNKSEFEPGDIIVIDPANPGHFLKSSTPYSPLVAGIYSTKPGYVGRRQKTDLRFAKDEIPMAMVGIVPTKVTAENGPIKAGDLLVTSSTPGYAMHGTDPAALTGAVVGKALSSLQTGTDVIEVLVSLQ